MTHTAGKRCLYVKPKRQSKNVHTWVRGDKVCCTVLSFTFCRYQESEDS